MTKLQRWYALQSTTGQSCSAGMHSSQTQDKVAVLECTAVNHMTKLQRRYAPQSTTGQSCSANMHYSQPQEKDTVVICNSCRYVL